MLEQKLYTVADVAELTGLTSRTIRNYLKEGTLRGRKIGVQWRFTEEDINRLFSEVDVSGKKMMKPEDVISDFLKPVTRDVSEVCFAWDIPFQEKEQAENIKREIWEFAEQRPELTYALVILEEQQVLRVAASGKFDKIEEFAVRMKKFE